MIAVSAGKLSASVVHLTSLLRRCTTGLRPPAVQGPAYVAAKHQWEAEGLVGGGAAQALPLIIGEHDLRRQLVAKPASVPYLAARAAFAGLETVPDAMVSPAQTRLADVAIRALKTFFGASMVDTVPTSPAVRASFRAWEREPPRLSQGVVRAPLHAAIAVLARESRRRPRARYYGALVDDLESLAAAPGRVTSRTANGIYGYEADFVNTVFAESMGLRQNVRPVLQP